MYVCVYTLTSLDVPAQAAADTAVKADQWSQRSLQLSAQGPSVSSAAAVCLAHPGGTQTDEFHFYNNIHRQFKKN